MNIILGIITNKFFLAPMVSWIVAYLLKVVIDSVRSGFCKERIVGGGGMPSSHAALVTALVCIVVALKGADSFEFAIALFFGLTAMYDSRRVRFETQRQGRALNNLNEERSEEGKQPLDVVKFREKVGHTISELLLGAVIGVICSIIVYHIQF